MVLTADVAYSQLIDVRPTNSAAHADSLWRLGTKGLESLYAEVQRLVTAYAREKGIQLVLQKPPETLEAANFEDYFVKVQLRTVVFHGATLDITDRIKASFAPRAPEPPVSPPVRNGG